MATSSEGPPCASCTAEQLRDAFPFPPYDIQADFMVNLCQCLDRKGIGLFESPTGTGKTLSLIGGLVTWLRKHAARELEAQKDSERLAAMQDASKGRPPGSGSGSGRSSLDRSEVPDPSLQGQADRTAAQHAGSGIATDSQQCEPDWLRDFQPTPPPPRQRPTGNSSPASSELSDAVEDDVKPPATEAASSAATDPELPSARVQVIFAARTHTQLSQFTGALDLCQCPVIVSNDACVRTANNE